MAAYVIGQIEVTDPVAYEEYRSKVAPTITAFGGRFLVRGGAAEVLEGDTTAGRRVLLEFPSMAQLKAWYASDAYKPLIALRQRASRGTLVAVEGVAPPA